jgi:hypothetical protein
MIIEDQTVEVKVWDHNDAVIFVYETIHETYDEDLSDDAKLEKVRNAADALSQLYSHAGDYEMGVSYYINHDPYINS